MVCYEFNRFISVWRGMGEMHKKTALQKETETTHAWKKRFIATKEGDNIRRRPNVNETFHLTVSFSSRLSVITHEGINIP